MSERDNSQQDTKLDPALAEILRSLRTEVKYMSSLMSVVLVLQLLLILIWTFGGHHG